MASGPATSWPTTARGAGTVSPSPAAVGIADVVTNFGAAAASGGTPEVERRRAAARGADDRGDLRRRARRQPLRAERPRARHALLQAKLAWFERLRTLARRGATIRPTAGRRRRLQRRADRRRRLGPSRAATAAPTSRRPSGRRFAVARRLGARRRLSALPARARALHVVGLPRRQLPQELRHAHRPPAASRRRVAERVVWAEIDREARKGKPIPSDHAPLVVDLR